MGVWCSRSTSSSTSARCLSSAVSSASDVYLHSGPCFACPLRFFFCSLKRSGFFTLSAGSGCVDSSEDVIDNDWTWSTSVDHDVGASRWWDWEWIAFAAINWLVAGLAAGGMHCAAEVEVAKGT